MRTHSSRMDENSRAAPHNRHAILSVHGDTQPALAGPSQRGPTCGWAPREIPLVPAPKNRISFRSPENVGTGKAMVAKAKIAAPRNVAFTAKRNWHGRASLP